jgi:hypothetical protein
MDYSEITINDIESLTDDARLEKCSICYADGGEIISLANSFGFDKDEVFDNRNDGNLSNEMIERIFSSAKERLTNEENENRVTFFVNCLDSHFYIDDESVYSFDEAKEALNSKI